MEFLNKTFKNRVTGDTFKIIDVYQNIAITSSKEKINTSILANDKLFLPINDNFSDNFSNIKNEDIVDPNNFLSSDKIYNTFADKIKEIPLDKLPQENVSDISDESAIIITDTNDEIEELKRKYGATSVDDSLRKQNEAFSKILNDEENLEQVEAPRGELSINGQQQIEVNRENIEPSVQKFEVQREDPIITMFKNVKRNIDFEIDLKVDGKIPRLDFIEMMEDSYEVSIIEFIANEFTNNILENPNLIKEKIIDRIKEMIAEKENTGNKTQRKTSTRSVQKKVTEKKNNKEEKEEKEVSKDKKNLIKRVNKPTLPEPPSPPNDRILKEGEEPEKPKSMI
jgi:hypothetical protein